MSLSVRVVVIYFEEKGKEQETTVIDRVKILDF